MKEEEEGGKPEQEVGHCQAAEARCGSARTREVRAGRLIVVGGVRCPVTDPPNARATPSAHFFILRQPSSIATIHHGRL